MKRAVSSRTTSANTHLTRCPKEASKGPSFAPDDAQLKRLAQKHEDYKHNNNVFNGRNISDHTPASRFY